MKKSLLVTVGTTGFDQLIQVVSSSAFAKALYEQGYSHIFVQYGSSKNHFNPQHFKEYNIGVDSFDYCPSLSPYFSQVQLVIGHAGAGTILDTLRNHLPLIVVVNENLMNNHQHEIADAMVEKNCLLKAIPETLITTFQKLPFVKLSRYSDPHPEAFASYLNRELHID